MDSSIIGGKRSTLNPNTAEFRVEESGSRGVEEENPRLPDSPALRFTLSDSYFSGMAYSLEERIGKAHNGARGFPRPLLLIPNKRQKRSRPPRGRPTNRWRARCSATASPCAPAPRGWRPPQTCIRCQRLLREAGRLLGALRAQSEGWDLGGEGVFTGCGSIEDREQLPERLMPLPLASSCHHNFV